MPLKVYRRSSGIYHLRGTFEGHYFDKSLGTRDRTTADRLRQAQEHKIIQEEYFGIRGEHTFAEATTAYLNAGRSDRFTKPLVDHLGNKRVGNITRADLDEFARLRFHGRSDSTINRQVYAPGSAILNFAADLGWRPPIRIKKRPEPKGRTRWLTVDEAEELVAHAGHLGLFVSMALESAARTSELLRLEYRDVDLDCHRFVLWADNTKTSTQRFGHFGTRTRKLMSGASGPVIVNTLGKGINVPRNAGSAIARSFSNACKRAALKDVTPHTLRHTWATWAIAVDPNLIRVKAFGGWSSTSQLERYAKLTPPGYGKLVLEAGWELFGKEPVIFKG